MVTLNLTKSQAKLVRTQMKVIVETASAEDTEDDRETRQEAKKIANKIDQAIQT